MATHSTDRPLVNIMQAAEIAGVSRRCIYNWMRGGKLPFIRTVGGQVRIERTHLFRPATSQTEVTAPQ